VTRRHHTVPQVYLRAFADSARRVRVIARDDPARSQVTSVRNACVEVGFYRVDPTAFEIPTDRTPPDPEAFEAHLSAFESRAASGLNKLSRSGMSGITKEDWYHLINFIALQTVRGNRFRQDLDAVVNRALATYLGQVATDDHIWSWLEQHGEASDESAVAAFRHRLLGDGRPRLVPPQEFYVQESMKVALTSLSGRLATGWRWSVIESREPVLTSDEPVCWWGPGDEPIGFATAPVVWLPLGPRRILQLMAEDEMPTSLGLPGDSSDGRDQLVRRVNVLVAEQSHRWIVHHPADLPLEGVTLGPRTEWAEELVDVIESGEERRELWIHRRRPVPTPPVEEEAP